MNDVFNIGGRRALVMGGTSGIGKQIAVGLARSGAMTVATGRTVAEVDKVTGDIKATGAPSFAMPCDATDASQVQLLALECKERLGGLDILVYAAGMTVKKPTADLDESTWDSVMRVNVDGALRTCQAFYPLLKESPCARIVTIASLSSFVSFHQVSAYCASKAALLSLTKSLACEWADDGIRVNAIVPGVFVTNLNRELLNGTERGRELLMRTPMKRFGDVSELVGAALFLCSDAASFVTGTSIVVDGGFLASGVNQ